MKTGFNKTFLAVSLFLFALPAFAMPGTVVATYFFTAGTFAFAATAFAVNMVASAIITKAFFSPEQPGGLSGLSDNPGNRVQIGPATDNKLPVVYGQAWVGGTVVDLSISNNNQELYYVIAISEVTDNGSDTITFGDVYWGGKKCTFASASSPDVISLTDESTGTGDNSVNGKLQIFLYNNGSNSVVRGTQSAIQVMQTSGLTYTWDNTKLMTNCAFAIVHITYSSDAGLTGIQQTKFQVTNSRSAPGDCFLDYLTNDVYGAALPLAQIDTASLTALNTYSNQLFTYTPAGGGSATQTRFRFDGVVDTNRSIMDNLQDMASCCDCLIKYNEITSLWGVVVQSPSYSISMALDDSNIVSSIQVTPLDIAGSYNVIECKFPDKSNQDSFNAATFDLLQIAPGLLYPNEPVNKQSVALSVVNDSVRAQYLAIRMLKGSREDLQVQLIINYQGIQLEAGDIVTVTNANYGWVAKEFRVMKVTEDFASDNSITAKLFLTEFNATVYDDVPITQFTPAPNTGIPNPLVFGTLTAPLITNLQPSASLPTFDVIVTAPLGGVVQYAEIWYSAFSTPSESQLIFAGTTEVRPNGNPYLPLSTLPPATVSVNAGSWYFFAKMVNSLGTSGLTPASSVVTWRPLTIQFTERYLAIAYADNATGTSGFAYSPRNKSYFGIYNNTTANGGTNPALYTWYQASANFGTTNYLLYANRTNRKFSFGVGNAGYANLGGAFVPTETSIYDSTLWSGLLDPASPLQSFIDLDARTGQLVNVGYSGINQNDGFLSVTNNADGTMRVALQKFLNFGTNVYTKSFTAATLTIDIYGRVVGFTESDEFYFTETIYTATSGQTTFSNTHTVGWILVFRNGLLLDPSEYTETSTTVVMTNACAAGETIGIVFMRGVSTSEYYEPLNITIASSTSNTVTYSGAPYNQVIAGNVITFANTGSPTQYTVQSVNQTTKVITFTTTISGATAGLTLYRYRAAGSSYPPFTRYDQDVSGITTFTPTTYAINNGFESIYTNGSQLSEIDYNITGSAIDGFPGSLTGRLTILMYTSNNLGVPASNITNTVAYSTNGQTTYPFANNPLSMQLYANGAYLYKGASYDYTASSSNFILTSAFNNNTTLLNQQTFARLGPA